MDKKLAPLFTQLWLNYLEHDCGMGYLIRLEDGGFCVLDGGVGESEEPEHLLELMRLQSGWEKPEIRLWFFSHAHVDHTGCFEEILERFCDRVSVKAVAFNFPDGKKSFGESDMTRFRRLLESHPEIERICPCRGDTYVWGNVALRVLFTQEDLTGEEYYCNDTSMVLRLEACGHSVLFPGDAGGKEADEIMRDCAESELTSEVLQVPHHGYWGGNDSFFKLCNPEILLWPCPDYRFKEVEAWECNKVLAESRKIRRVLCAGRREDTFDLTDPDCFRNAPEELPAERCEADLSAGKVYPLHWSGVVGGYTENVRVQMCAEDGGIRFLPREAGRCVLELLQPGTLNMRGGFRWSMRGRLEENTEAFGILPDEPLPTVWREEACLWVPKDVRGEFSLTLLADAEAGTLTMTVNGREQSRAWEHAEDNGLYLALFGGELFLREVRAEALKSDREE